MNSKVDFACLRRCGDMVDSIKDALRCFAARGGEKGVQEVALSVDHRKRRLPMFSSGESDGGLPWREASARLRPFMA